MQSESSYKEYYYETFFQFEEPLEDFINKLSENYLNGIDFVFKYYLKGCPSWDWYYQYNYSPLMEDVYNFAKQQVDLYGDISFDYPESIP
jgi:5'-3' exonuclease